MIPYVAFYLYDLCHLFTIKNEKRRKKSLYFYEDCRLGLLVLFFIDYDVFQAFGIFIFPLPFFGFRFLLSLVVWCYLQTSYCPLHYYCYH